MMVTSSKSRDIVSFQVVEVITSASIHRLIRRCIFRNVVDITYGVPTESLCTSRDFIAFFTKQVKSFVNILKMSSLILKFRLKARAQIELKHPVFLTE